jgi:hypothetical protein
MLFCPARKIIKFFGDPGETRTHDSYINLLHYITVTNLIAINQRDNLTFYNIKLL